MSGNLRLTRSLASTRCGRPGALPPIKNGRARALDDPQTLFCEDEAVIEACKQAASRASVGAATRTRYSRAHAGRVPRCRGPVAGVFPSPVRSRNNLKPGPSSLPRHLGPEAWRRCTSRAASRRHERTPPPGFTVRPPIAPLCAAVTVTVRRQTPVSPRVVGDGGRLADPETSDGP